MQSNRSTNNSLQQKRQTFHKQIRRQHIQTYIKNKRKQLFNQSFSNQILQAPHLSRTTFTTSQQQQSQYESYIQNTTLQIFEQDPNTHLQMFVQIMAYKHCHKFKRYFLKLLVIVHDFVFNRLRLEIEKVEYLQRFLGNLNLTMNEEQFGAKFTPLVVKILAYNEIFFQPMKYVSPLYAKNNKKHGEFQENSHTELKYNQKQHRKLNINLVQQFFIYMIFEITSQSFAAAYAKNFQNSNNLFNNGYDQLLQSQSSNIFKSNLHLQKQKQLGHIHYSNICQNIYKLSLQLITISGQIRYQINKIQIVSRQLNQVYTMRNNSVDQLRQKMKIPELQFNPQRIFVRQANQQCIQTNCLQIICNITAQAGTNKIFDEFLKRNFILNALDELAQEGVIFLDSTTLYLAEIYANLIQSELTWWKCDQINQLTQYYNEQIESQQRSQLHNKIALYQPPGLYKNLLEHISLTSTELQTINLLIFILVQILQTYKILQQQQFTRLSPQNQLILLQEQQLIMGPYYCESIASIISSLVFNIQSLGDCCEVQHLSELFILICSKMMPYVLHFSKLAAILEMVVVNQNKRLVKLEMKAKSRKNYQSQIIKNAEQFINGNNVDDNNDTDRQKQGKYGGIVTQKQEVNKRQQQQNQTKIQLVRQNIKRVIKECGRALFIVYKQLQKANSRQNGFNTISLDCKAQIIPQTIIQCIFQLWKQNQLSQCYKQFVWFIQKALKYFPQNLISIQFTQKNQQIILLLQQVACDQFTDKQKIIEIFQNVLEYFQDLSTNKKQAYMSNVLKIFACYRKQWYNILQVIETLVYKQYNGDKIQMEKNINKRREHELGKQVDYQKIVQQMYEKYENWLKMALSNEESMVMEME